MRQSTTKPHYPSDEQIEALTAAVFVLTDQVRRALRMSVDEIEQELGWAIRTKVLDRLPRPEHPCDERFELPATNDHVIGLEHACDSEDEIVEMQRSSPSAPSSRNQTKLW